MRVLSEYLKVGPRPQKRKPAPCLNSVFLFAPLRDEAVPVQTLKPGQTQGAEPKKA